MNDFLKLIKDCWTKSVGNTSVGGVLDKVDWAKITRNTLQVSGSAALSAGVAYFGSEMLKVDWGTLSVMVLPLIHFAMDAITRKFRDNTKE